LDFKYDFYFIKIFPTIGIAIQMCCCATKVLYLSYIVKLFYILQKIHILFSWKELRKTGLYYLLTIAYSLYFVNYFIEMYNLCMLTNKNKSIFL